MGERERVRSSSGELAGVQQPRTPGAPSPSGCAPQDETRAWSAGNRTLVAVVLKPWSDCTADTQSPLSVPCTACNVSASVWCSRHLLHCRRLSEAVASNGHAVFSGFSTPRRDAPDGGDVDTPPSVSSYAKRGPLAYLT